MTSNEYYLRNYYPKSQLETMPVVILRDTSKLIEIMSTWEYNPIEIYRNLIKPMDGEQGCTDQARYVLKTDDNNS